MQSPCPACLGKHEALVLPTRPQIRWGRFRSRRAGGTRQVWGLEATLDRDGGHPGEPEYKVLEAVLVKTKAGSAWTVRFGAKGNDDDEVIVAIALDKLHEMSLARSYSLAEIKALTDVTAHVAGESAEE